MKTVEILLAVYNGSRFLNEQIQSILNQTYPRIHLLIRDNASTDETPNLLKQWATSYPNKISVIYGEDNLGVVGNFSTLLDQADAPYVMFSDADDVWLKDKVEKTLNKMQSLKGPALVHTDLCVVNSNLQTIHPSFWSYTKLSGPSTFNRALTENVVTGCTMMLNRPLVDLTRPIPLSVPMHDAWIFLIASAFGTIATVPEATILYRQHGNNDSGASRYSPLSLIKKMVDPVKRKKTNVTRQKRREQAKLLLDNYPVSNAQKELINAYLLAQEQSLFTKTCTLWKYDLFESGIFRKMYQILAVFLLLISSMDAVELRLKKRQPNWIREIVSEYRDKTPQVIIFYAPHPTEDREIPVKWMQYDSEGYLACEADLDLETYHGPTLWYDRDGRILKMASFVHGVLEGPVRTFHSNGNLENEWMYHQGILDGTHFQYDQNGKLLEEGNYFQGLPDGEWRTYHPNSALASKKNYDKGLLEGQEIEWFRDGSKKGENHYLHSLYHRDDGKEALIQYRSKKIAFYVGVPHGKETHFHPNGRKRSEVYRIWGKKEGEEKFFDPEGLELGGGKWRKGIPLGKHVERHHNGQTAYIASYDSHGHLSKPILEFSEHGTKIAQYNLIGDEFEGPFYQWYPDGKQKALYHYINGKLGGEQITYFPNGQMRTHYYTIQGRKEGLFEKWFDSGQLKERKNFTVDNLHGHCEIWHQNGQLKYSGDFVNGGKEGHHQRWNEEGILLADEDFQAGIRLYYNQEGQLLRRVQEKRGLEEKFNPAGQLVFSASWKEGCLHGPLREWDEEGVLIRSETWKEGRPIGVHTRHNPKQQLTYDNEGKLHGRQYRYYSNGQEQSVMDYEHGILHGSRLFYKPDGEVISEAHFNHGKLEGKWFELLPTGERIYSNYKNNRLHGLYQEYYPGENPFKKIEATYVRGQLHGGLSEYNELGKKVSCTEYNQGKKEGLATLYTLDGRVHIIATFKNDNQEGPASELFPNGEVYKTVSFQNDLKEGPETTYFQNGNIESISNYHLGKLHGLSQQWNENGILIFEAEYKEGLRHGICNRYHNDGSPHIVQTFVNDVLQPGKRVYNLF